jgi:hypothetical protein
MARTFAWLFRFPEAWLRLTRPVFALIEERRLVVLWMFSSWRLFPVMIPVLVPEALPYALPTAMLTEESSEDSSGGLGEIACATTAGPIQKRNKLPTRQAALPMIFFMCFPPVRSWKGRKEGGSAPSFPGAFNA